MDDPFLVRGGERLANLYGDGDGLVERQGTALQTLVERFAVDQLHDEYSARPRVFEPEDRGYVRVTERGEHLCLALESRDAVRIGGERIGQDFQRDVPGQLRVAGAIHLAHPARAQGGVDDIRAQVRPGLDAHSVRILL